MNEKKKKPEILIVEDEAVISADLSQRLAALGFEVCGRVDSGEKALKTLEQTKPDLILMDIVLKGETDGITAAEVIRDKWALPVVFITAYADAERLDRAKLTGPYGYIVKPFKNLDLKMTLEMALYAAEVDAHRRRAEAALRESEALLNAAGHMARIGGWELDAQTHEVKWTEQTHRIHEVPLDYKPPLDEAINFFHPDDREKLTTAINLALENGAPYDLELRFITATGKHLWARTKCQAVIVDGAVKKLKGTFQDISDRKRAEEELSKSEKRFRHSFENANEGICLVDLDGKFLEVNRRMTEFLGYTRGELEKMTINDVTHPDDRDKSPGFIKTAVSGAVASSIFEKRYIHKNGRLVWGRVSSSLVRDEDDSPQYFVSHVQDVTSQKLIAEELQKSEKRLKEAQSVAKIGSWDVEAKTGRGFWSDELYQLLGYQPGEKEASYNFFRRHLHPDDVNKFEANLSEYIGRVMNIDETFRYLTKNGVIRWARSLGTVEFDDQGKPARTYGTFQDITDQMQTITQIQRTMERLSEAQRIAGIGDWDWDPETDTVTWSENLYRIFDMDPNLPPPDYQGQLALYHPEDAKKLDQAVRSALESGTPYELEMRRINPSGETISLTVRGVAERDSAGKILRLLGSVQDITSRKLAELTLRESEEKLRAVINNTVNVIYMKDLQGRFLLINKQFEKIFDLEEANVIGRTDFDLFPRSVAEAITQNDRLVFAEETPVEFEEVVPHGDEPHTYISIKFKMRAPDGVPYGICGISTDITDRKRTEKNLQKSLEEKKISS